MTPTTAVPVRSRCRIPLVAAFAIVVLAATSAIATNAVAKAPQPAPHYKCEQAPAGGKGPIDKAMVRDTGKCFHTIRASAVDFIDILKIEAQACPTMTEDSRALTADGLASEAKEGHTEIAATRKAKRTYFNAESDWYRDRHKKGVAEKLDAVTAAVGKASLDADGFWSSVEVVAQGFRSNDCAAVRTKLGEVQKSVKALAGSAAELKTTLAALP